MVTCKSKPVNLNVQIVKFLEANKIWNQSPSVIDKIDYWNKNKFSLKLALIAKYMLKLMK